MNLFIETTMFLLLIASAIAAIQLRDLLAAVVVTSVFSFVLATLFVAFGAVDVGFTEAVVGAGVVGVYYIAMLLHTEGRADD